MTAADEATALLRPGEILAELREQVRAALPPPLQSLPGRTFEVPFALLALLGAYLLLQGRMGHGRLPMAPDAGTRREDDGFDL